MSFAFSHTKTPRKALSHPRTPQKNTHSTPFGTSMVDEVPIGSLYSDNRTVVEVYTPYPSQVISAMNDDLPFQSCRVDSASGLAWLASGEDIIVWPCDGSGSAINLTVDEGEEANAKLICIIVNGSGGYGILAVSEGGWVRYWRDCLDPATGIAEAKIQLPSADSICMFVEPADSVGAIVVTNAGILYQIEVVSGAALSIRGPISKPPGGVWAGISSILRFGAEYGASIPRALVAGSSDGRTRTMFLLTESTLQKWNVWSRGAGSFSWEIPLRDRVRDVLIDQASTAVSLDVWLCDVRMSSRGLIVLTASTLSSPTEEEEAVIAYTLHLIDDDGSPHIISTLEMSPVFDEENEYSLLEEINLQIPNNGPIVYVFTPSGIETVSLDDGEARRIHMQSLLLTGSGSIGQMAVAFPSFPESNLVAMIPTGTHVKSTKLTDLDAIEKKCELLSHAFSSHYYGPRGHHQPAPITASSDARACVMVSKHILDERAASDARWAEQTRTHDDTVIVTRQLEEKMRRETAFIEFIGHGRKLPIEGCWELLQHGEKLAAALALRHAHNDGNEALAMILFQAMDRIVHTRGSSDEHGVMNSIDLFFADVSLVHEILPIMAEMAMQHATETIGIASAVASMLDAAHDFRLQRASFFSVPEWIARADSVNDGVALSNVPASWTTQTAVLDSLIRGVYNHGMASSDAWRLIQSLSNLLLDGLKREAVGATISDQERGMHAARVYEDTRDELIRPLIDNNQHELAIALALEHRHYEALVEMSYVSRDKHVLDEYSDRFGNDFVRRMFQWMLSNGHSFDLLNQPESRHEQLALFLTPHPSLSWIHALVQCDYERASVILHGHAMTEKDRLARKKTLLSLAKVAVLAHRNNETENAIRIIDDALYIIKAQEMLDPDASMPLPISELVKLCIDKSGGDRYRNAILAHELVMKSGMDQNDVKDVWLRTLLADNWAGLAERRNNGTAGDDVVTTFVQSSLLHHVLVEGPYHLDSVKNTIIDIADGHVDKNLIQTAFQLSNKQ